MWNRLLLIAACVASPVVAQDKAFTLQAPDALVDTGFLQHLLPRFSLKTGIRITIDPAQPDATFGSEGVPVFKDDTTIWHFSSIDAPYPEAFEDWLLSDIGKRTIEGFAPDGTALFSTDLAQTTASVVVEITGDAVLGEEISLRDCGRCHVVNDSNRMNAIGSTPSFALMRTFEDWEGRFQTFFLLKPHPAFTQVTDITDPFPENLPSPIAPIEVTLDEIDAIVAYVATIAPADLGAPVQSR